VTRFARRAAAFAALVAAPVVALAGPAFASDASSKPAAVTSQAAYETQVVNLTNAQRKAHGCRALRIDNRLITSARAHSTDMVKHRYFDHGGSDGSTFVTRELRAGYPKYGPSAENIAWGYRTPQDVVTAWMHSPGHRANILDCGSVAVGVGVAYTAGGSAYWTQDFGRI
jgi:uncharacterized protein YkwD